MKNYSKFDFYSPFNLSDYSLGQSMRYQLSLLDNLDVKTKIHSENVANVSGRICEYLGCKPEFTLYTVMCAYLHDIGKIFIPKNILFKDGPLTDDEYEIMKNHTTYGYNLCINDPKLKMFAEGTLYHHECLDGSGYPNGVKGKSIPYSSQIIHVADVYDALVTKRHYKTHVNVSNTLKQLIEDSNPSKNMVAFDELSKNLQVGKIDKVALNALFKVVIDDTNLEIASTKQYLKKLKNDVSRLEQIEEFDKKRKKAKSESKKQYFENGMNVLFEDKENKDNYLEVLEDYRNAIDMKIELIDNLNEEVKILKKLKA